MPTSRIGRLISNSDSLQTKGVYSYDMLVNPGENDRMYGGNAVQVRIVDTALLRIIILVPAAPYNPFSLGNVFFLFLLSDLFD